MGWSLRGVPQSMTGEPKTTSAVRDKMTSRAAREFAVQLYEIAGSAPGLGAMPPKKRARAGDEGKQQPRQMAAGCAVRVSATERARLLAKYAGQQARRSDNRSARAALNDIASTLERRQKALMKGYTAALSLSGSITPMHMPQRSS